MLNVVHALEQLSDKDRASKLIASITVHPLNTIIAESLYEKIRERDNTADRRYALEARRKKADKYVNTAAIDADIKDLCVLEDTLDDEIEKIVHSADKLLSLKLYMIVQEFTKY